MSTQRHDRHPLLCHKTTVRTVLTLVLIGLFAPVLASSAAAQGSGRQGVEVPRITVEPLRCVPQGKEHHDGGSKEEGEDLDDEDLQDNAVINVTISPEVAGAFPRLFFRWTQDEDFYYVPMAPDGNGKYWAVLPEAAEENEQVEHYTALLRPDGQVLAKSESFFTAVTDDCQVRLTPQQAGVAENLVVGETTAEQREDRVIGFLCDGIVTRINPGGVRRADERCRICIVWVPDNKPPLGIILPAAAGIVLGGVILSDDDPPEASPTTP